MFSLIIHVITTPPKIQRRLAGRISIYVMAMIKLRGGAAWGPPARPDRLDFLEKEGGLPGDRRDRTPIPNQVITSMEMLPGLLRLLTFSYRSDKIKTPA
jgi:hypothetical protein